MKARDVMTTGVVTVSTDDTVLDAAKKMLEHHISGLPVVDAQGDICGIVSEGDFLRRGELDTVRKNPRWLQFFMGAGKQAQDYTHTHTKRVSEVMSRNLVAVTEGVPLERVVELMERHRIKRVPVVRDAKVIGIVTRANLLQALAAIAEKASAPSVGDAALRDLVISELSPQPWVPSWAINPIVSHGVVHLHGVITDERERAAIRVLVENVPGVTGVVDHLAWVEPYSGMSFYQPDEQGTGQGLH